jgi:predicted ribosomally synthesized peptide with SipW-like signal peptide
MTNRRKLQLLVLCVVVGIGAGITFAAFSSQTSNSGNTFSAAGSFGTGLRMASGTYTGDGTANRQITGLGFKPDVVIVKGNSANEASMRTSTMPAGQSKRLAGAAALDTLHVQSLDADGFTVGSSARVNANNAAFYWVAFKAAPGALKVGTYTGNGTSQSITGIGFSPEYLIVADQGTERAIEHFGGATNSYRFDADAGLSTRVTSVNADGFSVGSATEANRNTRTFHYVAFNEAAGAVKLGTYAGNGTAGNTVSGVGFAPEYVIVRGAANVTGQHRSASVPGAQSLYFQATANLTTGITALQNDGFQLGTNSSVNTNATTYQYVAFGNTGGGCAQPSSQTLLATADSWVDEAAPSASNGAAANLRVRSQTGGQNQRAFAQFDLPALQTGCVVTSANYYMYNSAPVAGRTLEVHRAAASWTENGITWADQPATTGTPATATTTGTVGWLGWDVTDLVSSQYASGNNGFRVSDQAEDAATAQAQQFGARESGFTPPAMVLTVGG